MLMHSVGFDSENVCQEMKWSVHQRYVYKCIKAEQHNVVPWIASVLTVSWWETAV